MSKKPNWFLINENYGANLCPFAFHFDADYHGFKKVFGRGMNYQGIGTENGFMRQTYDIDDYNSFAQWLFKKLATDKPFARRMLKNIYMAVDKQFAFDKGIVRAKLSRLSDKELAQKFKRFYQLYYNVSIWSVPFAFSEYGTPLWTNALTKYLNSLKIPNQYTTLEIYQLLTTHNRQTYTAKEKMSLLNIAVQVQRLKKLKVLIKKKPRQILKTLPAAILQQVKKHERQFNWINYGFQGPLLSTAYFIGAIRDWIVNKDPSTELRATNAFYKTLTQKQVKLSKQLKIDAKHRWMFWVVKEFGFQKAYRKDIEYHSFYTYEVLLRELGKRLHISVEQGHYLLLDEIVKLLQDQKEVDEKVLNERIKCNFYVVIYGKAKLLVGKQAKTFIKQLKTRPVPKGIKELTGQCACKGKATGNVRIIKNQSDYKIFNKGDVLVTWATNPTMVPLMKKAAAVVTDEGGVTCHAAIVSRELGVPCVIGTGFATKILKSGSTVQVDATRGIVKKI